ncbi:MAG TPA: 50S ribosomal protein L6 [Thermoplasmata archaeon]|nr:50S ribosomal protein L6 [Thermoplasmata archaeon]
MSTEAERSTARVAIPDGVKLVPGPRTVRAEGPKGKVARAFPSDVLALTVVGSEAQLALKVPSSRKRDRALLNTWAAHLRNLVGGVARGVEARMKVVAAHFPMKVQAKEATLVIENFLGEKYPRTAHLIAGVEAVVDGDIVTLRGADVEIVGQSAANVERTTRIRDYDPRVFQDGIYLIERAHVLEAA